jgi:dihydroorotase-like cyclic amidohydrolase
VSSAEALDAIADARRRGLPVFAEVCPHCLYLDVAELDRPVGVPVAPVRHAPRQGSLVPGSHADVTVLDPRGVTRTSASDHHMKVDHSVFESLNLRGSVHSVFLRGQRLVHKGQWVGPENDGLIDSAGADSVEPVLAELVQEMRHHDAVVVTAGQGSR